MKDEHVFSAATRIFVVAHTHWDRAWYLPFEGFRFHLVRLVDSVLDLLERDPEYRSFTLDGQTAALEDYLEIRPERRADVERFVRAGRLFIGPCFVLPDEFLVSGESLIRNLQRGVRTARHLGAACRDGYMPDSFGHIAQMPQILAGFGLRSFLFMRGVSHELFDRAGIEFEWEAPDGSRVLALYLRGGYDNASALGQPERFGNFRGRAPTPALAVQRVQEAVDQLAPHSRSGVLLLCNGCDHMPPQPELPRLLEHAREARVSSEIAQVGFADVVDAVLAARPKLEVHRGELLGNAHHPILSSVWSARTPLKVLNHQVESFLEKIVEPLVATLGPSGLPHVARIEHAWRELLLCHPHDDVCGCSIDAVHVDAARRYEHCQETAQAVVEDALRALALRSGRTSAVGREILVVFNPHPEDIVESVEIEVLWRAPLDLERGLGFTLTDADGRAVRVDVDVLEENAFEARHLDYRRGTRLIVAFEARVPALGVAFFELVLSSEPADWREEEVHSKHVENEHYRVEARRNGTISITHKPSGRVYENALLFEDQADVGDLYSFSPSVELESATTRGSNNADIVVMRGPHAATMYIDLKWTPDWLPREMREAGAIDIVTEVRLADGSDQLEFRTTISTTLPNHRLRVLLPIGRDVGGANSGAAFGFEARKRVRAVRPEDAPERWNGYPGELPYSTQFSRDLVHAEDEQGGVLVAHRGIHEYELVDNIGAEVGGNRGGGIGQDDASATFCALTLVRAVGTVSREGGRIRRCQAGPSIAVHDAQFVSPDDAFEYSWQAVPAGIETAEIAARAYRFAHPVHAAQVWMGDHERPGSVTERARYGLLEWHNPLVSLSALKRHADGRLVVRLWNRDSRPQKVMLALSSELCSGSLPVHATRCDLNEEPLGECTLVGSAARFELSAHQIATIAFTFEANP